MITSLLSRIIIIAFGRMYPAYCSFKSVRAKSSDDYHIWMIYWIVYACFSAIEVVADIFLSWFPFYYELKVLLVVWLLPTMGNGCPIVFRNCVYPFLQRHESHVDTTLMQVRERGPAMVFRYVASATLYFSKWIMEFMHKTIPNGLIDMLESNGLRFQDIFNPRSLTLPVNANQEERPAVMPNVRAKRKCTAKPRPPPPMDVDEAADSAPTTSRTRGRKARVPPKPCVNFDENMIVS